MTQDALHCFGLDLCLVHQPVAKRVPQVVKPKPLPVFDLHAGFAVIRAEQLANPLDPYKYRDVMIQIFHQREILTTDDEEELKRQEYLFERQRLSVFRSIDDISRSRAAAYRFLNDNRDDLFIPASQDFVITDLYDAHKFTRQATSLPRQVILEYIWREEMPLKGSRFGRFDGQLTSMLCGGTLVFDDSGNVLSWTRNPELPPRLTRKDKLINVGRKKSKPDKSDATNSLMLLQHKSQPVV
jgi:hypothetical protein